MSDILARRVEAVDGYLGGGPVHADDGMGAIAASDAVLREAGQRVWRCNNNDTGHGVGWLTGLHPEYEKIATADFMPCCGKPGAGCGPRIVIPADALAGEDE